VRESGTTAGSSRHGRSQSSPDRVAGMAYFMKETPKIDWQWMFVVGIFIGAFIAARTGKTFRWFEKKGL